MANTIEVSQLIANESLYTLRNFINMAGTVHRGLDREWETQTRKPGESITVRKPPTLVARDATADLAGAGLQTQNLTESGVTVALDKHKYVRVAVTDQELGLEIEDLRTQVILPQIIPLIEDIEASLHGLYADIPYFAGTAGTTPSSLDDIANCGAILSLNKAPNIPTRNMQIDPLAQAKFWPLLAALKAPTGAMNDALTAAAVGRTGGFDIFENQQVSYHTKGDLAGTAAASGTAGQYTITVASAGNAKTLKKGDLFTMATVTKADGSLYQFVCTEDFTSESDGTGTIKLYPALPANVSGKVITVIGSHRANLAYTQNAFCLAMARQPLPLGGATGAYAADPQTGMAVRTVYDWENMSNVIDVDILYGVKTLRAEEAVRLLG